MATRLHCTQTISSMTGTPYPTVQKAIARMGIKPDYMCGRSKLYGKAKASKIIREAKARKGRIGRPRREAA